MQDFTKLKVWQKAHRFAIDLKREIDEGPRWNFPGLRGQTSGLLGPSLTQSRKAVVSSLHWSLRDTLTCQRHQPTKRWGNCSERGIWDSYRIKSTWSSRNGWMRFAECSGPSLKRFVNNTAATVSPQFDSMAVRSIALPHQRFAPCLPLNSGRATQYSPLAYCRTDGWRSRSRAQREKLAPTAHLRPCLYD